MSQTASIEGELTVAVSASLKGNPTFPNPTDNSLTVLSNSALIELVCHSSNLVKLDFKICNKNRTHHLCVFGLA